MSLAGGGCTEAGGLYGEVQCIMGNGDMGSPLPRGQTDTTENITLLQLRWFDRNSKPLMKF